MSTTVLSPDRSLLNPRFEGYKLRFLPDETVFVFPLPDRGPSFENLPSATKLSYRKLAARVNFNNCFYDKFNRNGFFYFDSACRVIYGEVSKAPGNPMSYHVIAELPTPVNRIETAEFPSLIPLTSTFLLASDGFGAVYLLEWNYISKTANIRSHCTLTGDSGELVPSVLLDARLIQNKDQAEVRMLLYRTRDEEDTSEDNSIRASLARKMSKLVTKFIISFLSFGIPPFTNDNTNPIMSTTLFSQYITDSLPNYSFIEPPGNSILFGSTSSIAAVKTNPAAQDSASSANSPAQVSQSPSKEPPDTTKYYSYMWSQTDTDVTICIKLIKPITKNEVICHFNKASVQLLIRDNSTSAGSFLIFDTHFFDAIIASDSTWTLENSRILTLYLEKSHSGTRWTYLFDPSSGDTGVDETVDPNVLAEFKERLEKYTSDLLPSEENTPAAPFQEAFGQETEDIDFDYDSIVLQRFQYDKVASSFPSSSLQFLCSTFTSSPSSPPGVVLRYDVDAVVFTPIYNSDQTFSLKHTGTINALGFVQASKRDKRFLTVTSDNQYAVLCETRKHVYLYRQIYDSNGTGKSQDWAEQYVIDLVQVCSEKGILDMGPDQLEVVGVQVIGNGILVVLTNIAAVTIALPYPISS
ncbi:hypothetical protein BKA69DRAFT_1037039 [Paraphysoderma sedebokerense]|nr:hypothetical protein BKA69DRAFT_1037039 [Paraphysoderma sedebokerense]